MNPKITILTDGSHRSVQAHVLAKYIEDYNGAKQIIISCGIDVVDKAVALKNPNSFLVSILDPTKRHEEFDLIVVPEHDPIPAGNVTTTKGLLNEITPELLTNYKRDFGLSKPCIAVLIGGRHIGGNVDADDVRALIKLAESQGESLLITTSKRTEDAALKAIKPSKSYFLWNYNHEGQAANPYLSILAAADKIIVTADSVRMCSEAVSSGKPIEIFRPKQIHFSYQALANSLQNQQGLNEAKRIAEKIKQLVSKD
jgi:mitochondrial fission protein ELM1